MCIRDRSICTSMQNFRSIALKMAELWSFENVGSRTLTYDVRRTTYDVTTESSSKSKSIWPIYDISLLQIRYYHLVLLLLKKFYVNEYVDFIGAELCGKVY